MGLPVKTPETSSNPFEGCLFSSEISEIMTNPTAVAQSPLMNPEFRQSPREARAASHPLSWESEKPMVLW